MAEDIIEQGFAPYMVIFPKARKGWEEFKLLEKSGKAKPGAYLFVETYCIEKDCDCRQVILQVINKKQRTVAVIDFSLDIDSPFNRPYLNGSVKQSPAAADFLELFVEILVDTPDWYRGMCQCYRAVRKKIDGRPYRGKRFPSKANLQYLCVPTGEGFEAAAEALLSDLESLFTVKDQRKKPLAEERQGSLFGDEELSDNGDIIAFANAYKQNSSQYRGTPRGGKRLQSLLQNDQSAEEFVAYLVDLYAAEDDDGLDSALLLLGEVMDMLRTDLERHRPLAKERMEFWQTALAQHVFTIDVDPELGAEITRILLNARVDILPQLHQANTDRMYGMEQPEGFSDIAPEVAIESLLAEMEESGVNSSFEMVDALLQMMAIGHAEMQLVLCERMFYSDSPMAREAAVLMLFHPHEEVRERVANFLAGAEGGFFTPIILRRLIVTRNWFPDALRKKLDQAIAHARRARIECAPLNKSGKVRAYATGIDGANAQSLQIIIPQKRGYLGCSAMPKKDFGMADSFLLEIENKRHLQEFLDMLTFETGGCEVSMNYIDKRVCQVLADGSRNGKVPNHWLVAIAEQLGRDQWKAIPFDVSSELGDLQSQLQKQYTTKKAVQNALRQSSRWPEKTFAESWFEDDSEVDNKLNVLFQDNDDDSAAAIDLILEEILEPRRTEWLERFVLTATWLKAAKKPPIPWDQMCHVATAVADMDTSLKQIPLMETIATHTVGAYLGRLNDGFFE